MDGLYIKNIRAGSDGSPEGRERDSKLQNEWLAAGANLQRVHAASLEPILNALPDEARDRFVSQAISNMLTNVDATLSNPDRYPVVREVLALELSPQQRTQAAELIDQVKSESVLLARKCLVDNARYTLLDNAARAKVQTTPVNLYLESASRLRTRLSADLLALLSPEQRAIYDASDVLDPADISRVNDRP